MTEHIKEFIEQEFYYFHKHPEESLCEFKTAEKIEEELDKKDDIEINNDSLLNDDSNAEEIKEEDLDKYNPIKDDEDVLDLEDEENEENEN